MLISLLNWVVATLGHILVYALAGVGILAIGIGIGASGILLCLRESKELRSLIMRMTWNSKWKCKHVRGVKKKMKDVDQPLTVTAD